MKLKLALFFVVTLFIGGTIFTIPRKLVVKSISCESQFGPCSNELEKSLKSLVPNNYLSVKKALNKLLESETTVIDDDHLLTIY